MSRLDDQISSIAKKLEECARTLSDAAAMIRRVSTVQKENTRKLREVLDCLNTWIERCKGQAEKDRVAAAMREEAAGAESTEPSAPQQPKRRMTALDYLEVLSLEEFARISQLPPIDEREIACLDWDALERAVPEP